MSIKVSKNSRYTAETIEKMRKAKLGKKRDRSYITEEYREKLRNAHGGCKEYRWKGGITSENKLLRDKFRFSYAKQVLERDDFTCQICSQRGGDLHVDHIESWADNPDLRFELTNCRTVCRACHYYITFKRSLPKTSNWGVPKRART